MFPARRKSALPDLVDVVLPAAGVWFAIEQMLCVLAAEAIVL